MRRPDPLAVVHVAITVVMTTRTRRQRRCFRVELKTLMLRVTTRATNPRGNVLPGTGNARLSLGVADIRRATSELQARGVATTPVKEEPGGLLSYFKDPDGNELCLWQYASH